MAQVHAGRPRVNVLTSDKVADLAGGPAFHSTMVQISRVEPAAAVFGRRLAGSVSE